MLFLKHSHSYIFAPGFQVTYSNGNITTHGQTFPEVYEFHIKPHEYIVKVGINSGWLIDRLTFYTNTGSKHGPYGGPGGGSHTIVPPSEENCTYGHLAYVKGSVVESQGSKAIAHLTFVWGYYDYKSKLADRQQKQPQKAGCYHRKFSFQTGANFVDIVSTAHIMSTQ